MKIQPFSHESYMQLAWQEAQKATEKGEIPVGAVVACQQKIIAKTHNETERQKDVTAHAEILAITAASYYLQSKFLTGCALYVTLEPCPMCAGAIYWARPDWLIFGAADEVRGYRQVSEKLIHPKTKVLSGILAEEAALLMKDFFKKLR